MRRNYPVLLVLLTTTALAAQTTQWPGASGRIPWCSMVFPPQQIKGEMVYPVANEVSAPVVLLKTEPVVPDDKANLKARAVVCGIVSVDGRVHTTFMDRSVGGGLDEIAIQTVKQWKFRPAMRYGKPVAAPLDLTISFGH
jgi:hypothetical protein